MASIILTSSIAPEMQSIEVSHVQDVRSEQERGNSARRGHHNPLKASG